MKKVYVESLGCPKNLTDSELILFHLKENNFKVVQNPNDADTIIINTCGFIQKAKQESIDTILQYTLLIDKEIIVIGCLVNLYKDELYKQIPEVHQFYSTKEFLNQYFNITYNKNLNYSDFLQISPQSYSYVKISDGCSRKCSFCIIPLIKGRQFSRPVENIIKEIRTKYQQGIREFNFIAQDLINYQENGASLFQLIKKIDQLEEAFKIRLLYLYPDERIVKLAQYISDSKKIINYLDIPVQHISSSLLKSMNRPDNIEFYLQLFNKIKTVDSFILRSTFIIGFPGEDDKDHLQLKQFLNEIKFNWAGFYLYSDEKEAESYNLKSKVPENIAKKRLKDVVEFQKQITSDWLHSRINKIYDVVVDEIIPSDGYILTRSNMEAPEIDGNIIVKFIDNIKVGETLRVKITKSYAYDLEGEIYA